MRRQELKKVRTFVRSVKVCLELSIFIFLALSLRVLSTLLAFSLTSLSLGQTEPKILRLVIIIIIIVVSMKVIRHEVRRLFPSIAKPPHEQGEENV